MASKEANISALYAELNRLGQTGEYDRAIKTCNKILQQSSDEEEAFHCKIVCLIQLSKFQEALQTINKQLKLSKNLIFEKAYCQYRLNQPAEAYVTVNAAPAQDQKLRELKAQILYRLEQYDECFELYKNIIKNSNDEYEDEREANLSAVLANLYAENTTKELPKLREHTFELTYNAACQLVSRGLYAEAEKKLKAAEKLCRETLEEDGTSEEDVEAEIGIIKGQLAFCLQMQGRDKEAQTIYNALLKSKPSDIGLVAVASNNSVTINKDENVFDSKKKMKSTSAEGVEHKLTVAQRKTIALNQCLLTVYTNQMDQCKQLCSKLTATYPECAADAALIQATQIAKDNRSKEAVGFLKKFAENHKERELEIKLACVQLLLSSGEKKEACRILESLGDNVNRAGIISALVALYLSDSNLDKASAVFKNAVDWHKNRSSKKGDLTALWRQAAAFHLRNGDPQVAANSLEELLRLNPNDNKTLAQLVTAYAMFDPAKAQAVSKRLPPFNIPHSSDIEMLESSNWLMSTKIIKKVTKIEASPKPGAVSEDEVKQKKKKKNRKRKGKLPKNYQEGVTPDPERWLPKYERTGYRKKKDRRNKDIGKGTQGAASGASDIYDITKMPSHASKASSNPNSPATETQGPRHQQRRFQQKKKKKDLTFKLENYFDKSSLSLQDSDFLEGVESDVISFSEGRQEKRVLVFPPVNNYRRFLIHNLVNEQFPNLTTFSIGEGEARRPVLCFKTDYIQAPITKSKTSDETSNDRTAKSSETCPSQPKRERRAYAMPSIAIYRPPAARRLEEQTSSNQEREPINDSINGKHECKCPTDLDESRQTPKKTDSSNISVFKNAISSIRIQNEGSKSKPADTVKKTEPTVKPTVRLRRPDMKVYVPKARRMLTDEQKPSKEDSATQNEVDSVKDSEKQTKNVPHGTNSAKNSEKIKKPAVEENVNGVKNTEKLKKSSAESDVKSVKNSEQPKKLSVQSGINGSRNCEQPKKSSVQSGLDGARNSEQPKKSSVQTGVNGSRNSDHQKKSYVQSGNNCATNSEVQKNSVQNEFYSAKHSEEKKKSRELSEHLEPDKKQSESSSVCVRNAGLSDSRTVKFEAGAVYPVSPTSLWIEAQNEVEDVVPKKVSNLVPVEMSGNNISDTNTSKSSLERICDKKPMKRDSLQLNPEECDWESMFDDSGECLDPSLMEQLSSAVGAVTIEKPKSNYDPFRTKTLDLVGDEFPHVIEIYNFPPEFCHQDLVVVFSQFKNAGFEIKWVDDTHALGIFSNAQIVSEVLTLRHPFVKTRLLKDGTMSSKAKARRFAEHLLPYKPRPDTCPALARRLVTGALGVRLPTSREEREAERKILSEARERKRLEARQREEAWEGTFH